MTMRREVKGKLIVFAVSMAFFALGISAVYMERGETRTTLLIIALAGMLAVALRQTVRLLKKEKN